MTVEGLSPMTKVEVVVRSTDADAVSRQIVSYTSLPGVTGLGHHGAHDGRALFNDQDALTLTITVVPDDRAPALIAGLRELLERRPGVMFVSTVSVSRPHYFQ